jgi:MYXO-CTERM domain-containing protein
MHSRVLSGIVVTVVVLAAGRAEAAPEIEVSPLPITFGGTADTVFGGGPPGELQFAFFQIANTGDTPLVVTDMALTGPDAGIIAYDDGVCGQGTDCPQTFTLAPGQQAGFSLSCLPTQPGFLSATLAIASNAASAPTVLPVSCIANRPPVIAITPAALDFGIQHSCSPGDVCGPTCSTRPNAQRLTITNTAAPPSELDFTLPLPPNGPFDEFTITTIQSGPTYALAAGESLQLDFVFHPLSGHPQAYDAPLTLTSLYPGQAPVGIPFHAHGGAGRLAIDTPSFLGAVPVGQTLVTTITAHNVGSSCLDIVEVSTSGDLFLLGPTPATTLLAAGDAFSWTVSCTPTSVLGNSGELFLGYAFDNLDFQSLPFSCQGSGGALYSGTALLAFLEADAVAVGRSATQQLHLFNAGNQPTDLVAMISSDPHITASPVTGSLPITLAPGAAIDLDVTFTPTDDARVSATLEFAGSNGDGYTIEVFGDGVIVGAHVELSATHVDFPETFRHPTTPATQVVNVRNTAATELVLSAISVEGAGFSLVGPATATLAPGASGDLTIGFAPTAIGEWTGRLVLGSADDPQIARIDLAGRGIARELAVSPLTIDLGSVAVGTTQRLSALAPAAIAIRNLDAAASFTLSSATITGDPAFQLIGPMPMALGPGQRAVLDLAVTPTSAGEHTAVIDLFVDGDPEAFAHITVTAAATVATPPDPGGCGCSTRAPSGTLLLGLGVVVLVLGRRRRPG